MPQNRSRALAAAGAVLDAATVTVCALDAVSPQQAVALALPAGLLSAGALAALLAPGSRQAWRDGFRAGRGSAPRRP
jgi:hypothetical protein